MTEQQTAAMENYANRWANEVYKEMAATILPPGITPEDQEDIKKHYRMLGRATYRGDNNLDSE